MRIISTDELNRRIKDSAEELIKEEEKAYENRLIEAAEVLKENVSSKPILLLSGPSGSGKTTSALRIEAILDGWGCETHTLSMDSYFLPASETPDAVDENGEVDYESPLRLDTELLNDHLGKIANCEEIEIPKFNFAEQKREKGRKLLRKPGELVVIEGIHALNPDITGRSYSFATGIYVSVRTRMQNSAGELLHPSKIRVMRRLMRDVEHRGRKPSETLDMFRSVERGENLYIMPYKHRAHFDIDTFFSYEVPIYRERLIPVFEELSRSYGSYDRFAEVLEFLRELEPLDPALVPQNSLIREFIGGSNFEY